MERVAFASGVVSCVLGAFVFACAKAEDPSPDRSVTTTDGGGGTPIRTDAAVTAGDGGPQVLHESLTLDGGVRTYEMSIPAGSWAAGSLPLVVAFHGSNMTGDQMRTNLAIEAVAGGGAIFVYPNAIGPTLDWDDDDLPDSNDDVAFFDAMLHAIAVTYPYDTKRIFAAGFSRGGFFVNQLGCWRNGTIRAIAAYEGGGPFQDDGATYDNNGQLICPGATQPIAALIVHADDDPVVSISTGEKTLTHWTYEDNCASSSSAILPSPCVSWNGCAPPVVWCEITTPNGHTIWPSAGLATWNFFSSIK